MQIGSLSVLVILAFSALARAEDPEPMTLRMRMPIDEVLRYSWSIDSQSDSKGLDMGRAMDLKVQKSIRMTAGMIGEKPTPDVEMPTLLRFADMVIEESRQIGDATKSSLKVDKQNIVLNENGRVIIDSKNDIGLEKIDEYQRNLRFMEASIARLKMDTTGKMVAKEGGKVLAEAIHGGHQQGLFPLLPRNPVIPGAAWDDNYELPGLGDLNFDDALQVRTKIKFAHFEKREGREQALLDVLIFWVSRDLQGRTNDGLHVTITQVEGQGAGAVYFDPQAGRFTEGAVTFSLKYKMDGKRGNDQTTLDVKGKTRFRFKLLPPEVLQKK